MLDSAGDVLHFGNARAELEAAFERVVLAERSSLSRLRSTGPDLLSLLDRLSTGEVAHLAPGAGAATVVTSSKGRIVDRLFVHRVSEGEVLLGAGPGRGRAVADHLARYTFRERTELTDVTATTLQFTLSGPLAARALGSASLPIPAPGASSTAQLEPSTVHVLGEDGLATDGFSVVAEAAAFDVLWDTLARAVREQGGRAAGRIALEAWRVLRGLPASGHELTEDYNPLEAGLGEAVSFSKGCYVGQEVVARLRTYDKVSRVRVGIELPASHPVPEPRAQLERGGRPAGDLTSAVLVPGEHAPIGLAYLKKKEVNGDEPLRLASTGAAVSVVELPFSWPRATQGPGTTSVY